MRNGAVSLPRAPHDRRRREGGALAGAESSWCCGHKDDHAVSMPSSSPEAYGDYQPAGPSPPLPVTRDVRGPGAARPFRAFCNGLIPCEMHLLPGAPHPQQTTTRARVLRPGAARRTPAPRGTRSKVATITIPLEERGRQPSRRPPTSACPPEGGVRAAPFRLPGGPQPRTAARTVSRGVANDVPVNVVGLMPHPEHAAEVGVSPPRPSRRRRRRPPRRHRRPPIFQSVLAQAGRKLRGPGSAREERPVSPPVKQQCTNGRSGMTAQATPPTPASCNDTVEDAAATPDKEMFRGNLGLKEDEYQRICALIPGRLPRTPSFAMYFIMWSEHCSYSPPRSTCPSSSAHRPLTPRGAASQSEQMGQNAGVVDIGGGGRDLQGR